MLVLMGLIGLIPETIQVYRNYIKRIKLEFCFYYKKEKKGKIIDYLPMVEFPPMPLMFPLILPPIIVPLPVMLLPLILSIVAFWVTSLDPDFDSDCEVLLEFSDPDLD
jgi:hypothetical protein